MTLDSPVNNLTAALFFPRVDIANGVEFAADFIRRTENLLNNNPVVLPLNQPMPPEAPRIVLRSQSGDFVCEFAQTRVNFHYNPRGQRPGTYETVFPRYREHLYRVITALGDMLPARPARLGFVARLLKQTAEDGATALLDEFLPGDDRFEEACETHLNFLHLIDLEGTPCNRWTRFRTVRQNGAERAANVALFEIDVNTRAEHRHSFEPGESISFFLEADGEVRRQAERLLTFAADAPE